MTEGYLQVPQVWESEAVESEEESLAGKVEKERSLWSCIKLHLFAHVAYQAVAYQAVVHAAYQAVAYQAVVHAAYQAEAVVHDAACVLQVAAPVAVDHMHGGALVAVLQVAVVS